MLSAEDVELVMRISGADQVMPLQQMVDSNWPLIDRGSCRRRAEADAASRRP